MTGLGGMEFLVTFYRTYVGPRSSRMALKLVMTDSINLSIFLHRIVMIETKITSNKI